MLLQRECHAGISLFPERVMKFKSALWSGGRKLDPKDKLPAVGNTVNVKTATYTSNLGSAELLGEWTDPEFDPAANAPYEARVLEIPTPRWSTHWVAKLNLLPNPKVPASEQQRAWTSPVGYTPTAKYSCTT